MSYESKVEELIPQIEEFGVRPVTIDLYCGVIADINRDHGPDSPHYLQYHNADHTLNKTGRSIRIMQFMDISPADAEVVIISDGFHDRFQGALHGPSEQASADAAMEAMEETGEYTTDAIWKVEAAIHDTVWHLWRGGVVQHARTPLGKIGADSDTGAVGEEFAVAWEDNKNFYLEQTQGGALSFAAMSEFLVAKTLPFYENHEFHTQAARECFPHRAKNTAILRDIIRMGILPEELAA